MQLVTRPMRKGRVVAAHEAGTVELELLSHRFGARREAAAIELRFSGIDLQEPHQAPFDPRLGHGNHASRAVARHRGRHPSPIEAALTQRANVREGGISDIRR
jgi:hypothetical protein